MTYGFCGYHGIECDYKGNCIKCPHTLNQRWIPVSNRLPEDKQGCIVTVQSDSKTFIDIVTYYAEEHSFLYYKECNVLAWMPLPEPYKEDEADDKRNNNQIDS